MKKDNGKKIFTIVALLFSMIMIMLGITYALYTKLLMGNTTNIINTGTLYFSYDEANFVDNGVKIDDTYPIPDSVGKVQTGSKRYFDFSVNGKTTTGDINYEVVAIKQSDSTLSEEYVKIYLTRIDGNNETPSDLVMNGEKVKTYSELLNSTKESGKIIYTGKINNGTTSYHQNFRLRMWMSDTAEGKDEVFGKTFSIKVNVSAVQ